jgi:hypothetical protein
MREKDLMLDPFMRTLCEDLVVAYRSIGTTYAALYSASRESSQAKQETYAAKPNVLSTPFNGGGRHRRSTRQLDYDDDDHARMGSVFPSPPPLMRANSVADHQEYDDLEQSPADLDEVVAQLNYDSEDDINSYVMDTTIDMNTAAYTTPTRMTAIRMCSQPMDVDDENKTT